MQNLDVDLGAVNPDEAVALGAAVQAGILEGTVEEGEVIDVWQASLMRALATAKLKDEGFYFDGVAPCPRTARLRV